MYPSKIVMHVMQTDRVSMVFNPFAEGVRQPRKSPHTHSHGQVLPLNVTGRDMLRIRSARTANNLCALYFRRTVAASGMRYLTINFDKLSVVDICTEASLDRFDIGAVAVCCNLN